MKSPIWKTAQARAALQEIAQDISEFFGVDAPTVAQTPGRSGADWQWSIETLEVWTKAGQAEMNVTLSARFAHLYFRFDDPRRAVVFDRAERLNRFSGKWNRIETPDTWARGGKSCPATSLDMFRANLRHDFRNVADKNPSVGEVAAYRERQAIDAAHWAEMRAQYAERAATSQGVL